MSKIFRYATYCQIQDEYNADFLKALGFELSFFIQGAEFSKAYKGYINEAGDEVTWSGRYHLLSGNAKFSSGLLERVKQFYNAANKSFEIVDCRKITPPSPSIDIVSKLKSLNKDPYPYQLETVQTALNYDCGIIKAATGSGKTVIAALLTAAIGKPTTIFVVGIDLLYQFHRLFTSLFDQKIGLIGDGNCEVADINIATVWTVAQAFGLKKNIILDDDEKETKITPEKYKIIKDAILKSKLNIFDECHLVASTLFQKLYKQIRSEYIYGLSATPKRDDGADLLVESVLGNKIVDISAKQLISQGYLVQPNIRFLAVPPSGRIKKQYQTIYKQYIVENEIRNQMIFKGTQKLIEQNFKPLVLFRSIKHGEILYEGLKNKVSCALLSGKDSSKVREEIKEKFENNKLDCIIASTIFDIGIDLPSVSGLILGSSGKSSIRALQRIGRAIRKHPGKTMSAVLDFADQAPFLYEHALARRDIYLTEFDVKWPEEKEKP